MVAMTIAGTTKITKVSMKVLHMNKQKLNSGPELQLQN